MAQRSLKQIISARQNIRRATLHRLMNKDLMKLRKKFKLGTWS